MSSTIERASEQLADVLSGLGRVSGDIRAAGQLLAMLGWDLPPGLNEIGLSELDVSTVAARLDDLITVRSREDASDLELAAAVGEVVVALAETFTHIEDIIRSLRATPEYLNATEILDQFFPRLADLLVIHAFGSVAPGAVPIGTLLGVFEFTQMPADPAIFQVEHIRQVVRWDRFAPLLTDPTDVLHDVYGWGTADFNGNLLLTNIGRVLEYLAADVSIRALPPTIEEQIAGHPVPEADTAPGTQLFVSLDKGLGFDAFDVGATLYSLRASTPGGADGGIGLSPYALGTTDTSFPLSDTLSFVLSASADLQGGLALILRAGRDPDLLTGLIEAAESGSGPAAFGLALRLAAPPGERHELFSAPSVSFDAAAITVGVGVTAGASLNPSLRAGIEDGRIRVAPDGADGFLASILPADGVTTTVNLNVSWSHHDGLRIEGGAGLRTSLALHLGLGPLQVDTLDLVLTATSGALTGVAAISGAVVLGPLTARVVSIGTAVALQFKRGNLGPVDLKVGFKAPAGIGLSLDSGGFKGGGFLRFDQEKGEYAGALELDFNGLFSVKAIGIINTKMPDGQKGFSLLIVIAAEFTPIQLSFGFTLNGVGGIFGLNRRIAVAALAEGIRTNAVKSILFPENVIQNITRIISDIKQFFPPKKDHFVIGPMAKLGWGTPSIITVELALLLDLPDPMFAIVGVLKALLPEEQAPILRLQVNFIGVVDFDRGYIFFRADLFDSRLLTYSITGSMAFLVSWGEAKALALSVGGFHPDFRDLPTIPALPDGFRSMRRIGISLLSDDNPRLKVESYFAVTSNTVQFGARIELYAEQSGFNIYGFLGFDVLFQFDPFHFIAKLSGGVALRRHSSVIAGVNISATLTGPTPWDARGKATLSFLFFSISVGFHHTWGDPPQAIAGATEDLLKVLQREFADSRNWRADLPPNNHLHVSLRQIELPAATEMLVIHPVGVLTFSQRSLPLEGFAIAKFGNKKPLAENKFKITNANSDNAAIPADYQGVREQFAPANFLELTDSEKLTRKSFDNLPSGFKLTATADLLTTLPVVRDVEYELSYLRRERIVPQGLIKFFVLAYDRLVKGSAVRQSRLAQQQTRVSLNAPPQVGLPQETFAIANAADLKLHVTNASASGSVFFATQAEAYQQQQELIAQNPALAGQIQVVSHFELNLN